MWKTSREYIDRGRVQKFFILHNNKRILYSEVIERWQHDETFRDFFLSLLINAPFSAYFWETPAVTRTTINQEFEFVLVDSPQLAKVQANPNAFASHFNNTNKIIVTFPNLGNDALLIVPCPQAPNLGYTHLAAFVRQAPEQQKHSLWQSVGETLKQQLQDNPIWLSTSGLGVYWLHIRVDSFPKYYSFRSYKVSGQIKD
jgi:hypothetical protein